MKELEKYVGESFSINFQPNKDRFCIFTIPTQHFYVKELGELTPRFDLEIKNQKELSDLTSSNFEKLWKWKLEEGNNG